MSARRVALALLVAIACVFARRTAFAQALEPRVVLWHSYRDDEASALSEVLRGFRAAHPGVTVETLAVPFNAYVSKLETAVPHDEGPDLFVGPHDWVSGFVTRRLLASVPEGAVTDALYAPSAVRAFTRDGRVYAYPLALKCVALYLNRDLLGSNEPPRTLEALAALRTSLPRGAYALAYNAQNSYYHAAFAHAYGSGLLDDAGRYLFDGPDAARSVRLVQGLLRDGVSPDEADGTLVEQLFLANRALAALADTSLAARVGSRVRYVVIPLPDLAETGRALEPFATAEGAYVSAFARNPNAAHALASYLAGPEGSVVRARTGRQVVANAPAWERPELASDGFLRTFRSAAQRARVMPSHPNLRSAFEPATRALRKALRGGLSVELALSEGSRRFADATRPLPAPGNPIFAQLALGAFALMLALSAVRRARDPQFRAEFRRSVPVYGYVLHAVFVVLLLVVAPLVVGAATSLYAGRDGQLYYAGAANYFDILQARGASLFSAGSFYVVLLVTVLWTAANLTLHLALGVALALLLFRPTLKLKGIYRVLLILPWAVPSYVTALAWRGMFHRQTGAINAILAALHVEPVSWFARFSTAFTANLATNVWLGFPFMMVVTLGALAGIPRDLYEAAEVDGATPWQRFRFITLPLLRPALAPAVAMGAVWTFNQFNVIYLVSGGEPDGQTEILVTEAYRWAFTRQAQYGYAAAYAVLIFGILVLGTRVLDALVARVQGPARGAR